MTKKEKTIKPLAFTPKSSLCKTVYYVGFPKELKLELIDLHKSCKDNYKDEFGLPTSSLKKLLLSWLDGMVDIKVLRLNSDDSKWLTSCSKVNIAAMCEMIKVWIRAEFINRFDKPLFEQKIDVAINKVCPNDFLRLCKNENTMLFDENGFAQGIAFSSFPLFVVNELVGKTIDVNGQSIMFDFCEKNTLISQKISCVNDTDEFYSIVFKFSLQTIPPERTPILLCTPSVRRWIKGIYNKNIFLNEAVNAHIRVSQNKYCVIPIEYNRNSKNIDWKKSDRTCYDLYNFNRLPNAETVLNNCGDDNIEILLPFHNRTSWAKNPSVKPGVPIKDKAQISKQIGDLISTLANAAEDAYSVGAKWFNGSNKDNNAQKDISYEQLLKCADSSKIYFEIYCNDGDKALAGRLEEGLLSDVDTGMESCIDISIKDLGVWSEPMPSNSMQDKLDRRNDIMKALDNVVGTTASFVILPNKDAYKNQGDPKFSIRSAFAASDRIVQFITPLNEDESLEDVPQKLKKTKLDLYRQLGYLSPLIKEHFQNRFKNIHSIPKITGIILHHQLANYTGYKARFLPMFVTVDYENAKIEVECRAFDKTVVSYREACLEMAKLSMLSEFESKCSDASKNSVKQFFIKLKALMAKDDSILIMIESNGTTREICRGIADSEIAKYTSTEMYIPNAIDVGDRQSSYSIELQDTGIRFIRFRTNDEVPDYYTSRKVDGDKYENSSGLYKYKNVYWSISNRPNQKEYIDSYNNSKFQNPTKSYAEKDMIEIYPLQLQPGDDPDVWVQLANTLKNESLQYDNHTILPLPIHIGNLLSEYIF